MHSEPLSHYVDTLGALLDHQSHSVAELNNELLQDYHVKYRSEWSMFRRFTVEFQKFVKFARYRMEQFTKTGDLANLRVCMLLNQYVLGDDRMKDAVGLARERAKTGTTILSKLVVGTIHQLKSDLVIVKSFMGTTKGNANGAKRLDVDELEHFAVNMALIKVNYMLTNEMESAKPIGRFHDFENVVDSPNDNKLTNMRLAYGEGDKTKVDKTKEINVNVNSSINSIGAKLERWTNEDWKQFGQLRSQVKMLACALQDLERATVEFMEHGQQCGKYWRKMLGNNEFDYGVRCYLEKWESHQEILESMVGYLHSAMQRWSVVESAMRRAGKIRKENDWRFDWRFDWRARDRRNQMGVEGVGNETGIQEGSSENRSSENCGNEGFQISVENCEQCANCVSEHLCQKCESQLCRKCKSEHSRLKQKCLDSQIQNCLNQDSLTCLNSHCRNLCLNTNSLTFVHFRTLFLDTLRSEIVACVDNHAKVAGHLCLRTNSPLFPPEWPDYPHIVADYRESITFTLSNIDPSISINPSVSVNPSISG